MFGRTLVSNANAAGSASINGGDVITYEELKEQHICLCDCHVHPNTLHCEPCCEGFCSACDQPILKLKAHYEKCVAFKEWAKTQKRKVLKQLGYNN